MALGATAVRVLDAREVFVAFFAVTAGLLVTAGLAVFAVFAVFAAACLDLRGAFFGAIGAASGGCNWLGAAALMLLAVSAKSTGSLDHWIISVAA